MKIKNKRLLNNNRYKIMKNKIKILKFYYSKLNNFSKINKKLFKKMKILNKDISTNQTKVNNIKIFYLNM
jgi:hypothetical protein